MNVKSLFGFALGPVVGAFLGLVTVPVIAWVFRPEDVGRFNLLQVVLSFSMLLTVLGLDQAYVREFHESRDRGRLLRACFIPGFALLSVGILATLGFGHRITLWLFEDANKWFYPLTVIFLIATYISRFLSLILRMNERGLAFSMSQVIPKVLQLLLLGMLIWSGGERDFFALLCIALGSTLTVVFVYAWNTRHEWRSALTVRVTMNQSHDLLKFGLPLAFSGLVYWGLTATSTLILRSQSSLVELGIYSVTNSMAGAATIFQSIFTVVWAPTVYKWVSQGVDMARVDAIARQALMMVCAIFVLTGTFSWILDYLLPSHYANVKYLVQCAIAPPLLYTLSEVTCVGIGISRRTGFTVWITLAALATNVVFNLWLVPSQGAAGAVIANAMAYFVFFVVRTEASAYLWRQFPRKKLYFFVTITVVLAIVTVVVSPILTFHYSLVWLFLTSIVIWSFRDELAEFIKFSVNFLRNKRLFK